MTTQESRGRSAERTGTHRKTRHSSSNAEIIKFLARTPTPSPERGNGNGMSHILTPSLDVNGNHRVLSFILNAGNVYVLTEDQMSPVDSKNKEDWSSVKHLIRGFEIDLTKTERSDLFFIRTFPNTEIFLSSTIIYNNDEKLVLKTGETMVFKNGETKLQGNQKAMCVAHRHAPLQITFMNRIYKLE